MEFAPEAESPRIVQALVWFASESPIYERENEKEKSQRDERVIDATAMGLEWEPGENQHACEGKRYGGEVLDHRCVPGFSRPEYRISICER